MKIGIICPSEIAFRRFMPAVKKCEDIEYVGVAYAAPEEWFGGRASAEIIAGEAKKAEAFKENYGGKVFAGYRDMIKSSEIDAVYLPLPPALHYRWAKLALENGKHVFLEKPSATSARETAELVSLAEKSGLALHENYMFVYHDQLKELEKLSEKIGSIRLYRIAFGFPQRSKNDFRYNKDLGGGALLDCGGYTIKLASMLLGESAGITAAQLNFTPDFDVDLYGSATMTNEAGVTAQISFGMDNSYKCELEIWGSKGFITTGRVFTAPVGYVPAAAVTVGNETETVELPADDTFAKSIGHFVRCVHDENIRKQNYKTLIKQAELVEGVKGV